MKKLLLTIVTTLIIILSGYAQQTATITGKITTADGEPAIAVSVSLKGTSIGTMTNANGAFRLSRVKSGSYVLRVTAVGLIPEEKELTVNTGITTVNFTLRENASALREIDVSASRKRYKVDDPSPTLRLNEPLIQVPQNIQVITGDQIKDQAIFNMLEGVSRNVSGAVIQEHWGNYARINARGDRLSPFRNGVNIDATWGPMSEDMSFVDRIEFIKGPAAFMLANGNPTGFYNVVTKKPTGVTHQAFDLTVGSFNTYRATADFDGKLTNNGKLQYRLNLMGQLSDSYRTFDFNNRLAIAPVLRYKFDNKNTLTAEYTYQYQRMNAFGTAYLFSTQGYATLPRSFTNAPVNSPASKITDHSLFVNYEHQFNDKWKFTAQGAYFNYYQDAYSYWIDSIKTNGDVSRYLGYWEASNRIKNLQAFVNGEVQTGAIRHRILGGVDIGDKYYIPDYLQSGSLDKSTLFNIYRPNNNAVTLPVFNTNTPLSQRGAGFESFQHYQSVYAQDELGFFDQRLRLTLAGRYTAAKTKDAFSGLPPSEDHKFTPRVGLSFSIDAATSLYGVFDQAFVPQSGNIFGGARVKPITGNNLEGGIKRDWFGGKWSTSVTVYRLLKNNQLLYDATNSTSAITYYYQTGQTKTNGVEFDARGEILPGLSLMANYAYTNSRISKDDITPTNVGQTVPGYAKHVTNGWLTYRLQHGVLKGLGLSAGYQWQVDRLTWSFGQGEKSDLPDYFRLDAAASYQYKKYSLAVNVNNLLNKYLYSGGHNNYLGRPAGVTVYTWQAEAPTNVRATIGYRF